MAYSHQSSFLRQLKVNDPKDIREDMSLYTYVIELPGVKEEDVKIRVSEGKFLIIEAQGFKEAVSPWEAESEWFRKRSREMSEETERIRQKTREEIERRIQEQDRINKKRMKRHLKEMKKEKRKMKLQGELEELEELDDLEDLNRMSQEQATLFGNMAGYPFLHPASYHAASTSQQAYYNNSTYHQFPAAVHDAGMNYTFPQFNFSVPSSSFPPAAPIPFGHGGFAGSSNFHGAPASSTTGYDDVINSGVWTYGSTSSRAESAIPASTHYSFQRQGHGQVQGPQRGEFQQGQQQEQHYGNHGYPNFYSSQTGISQEHQQQQTQNDDSFGSTI